MKSALRVAAAITGIGLALLVFWLVVLTPIAWFDGHAKSAYLKQTRGIDLPWYQATWLNVEVNSVDAEVRSR